MSPDPTPTVAPQHIGLITHWTPGLASHSSSAQGAQTPEAIGWLLAFTQDPMCVGVAWQWPYETATLPPTLRTVLDPKGSLWPSGFLEVCHGWHT